MEMSFAVAVDMLRQRSYEILNTQLSIGFQYKNILILKLRLNELESKLKMKYKNAIEKE